MQTEPRNRVLGISIAFVAMSLALISIGCTTDEREAERSANEKLVDAMSREHADDRPVPSPAATSEPRGEIVTRDVVYASVAGSDAIGYLALPARDGEPLVAPPAILVLHEWWGLNDNVRSMARQLAGEGYAALAVDFYGGRVSESRDDARALMLEALASEDSLHEHLRQAHHFLESAQRAPRIGSIGWCFGGGLSLETALLLGDELDAAVMYYGRVVTDRRRLERLASPLLGLFASEDGGIAVADVRTMELALDELGKTFELHVYEGADHAFANPSGQQYQEDAARDAWRHTLRFFRETLGPESP